MSTRKISVVKVQQNSKTLFMGKMNAEDIKFFTTVDRFRADLESDHQDQGYQRAAEPTRYKKFANYLIKEEHPLCPTSLLLSARHTDLQFDEVSSQITLDSDQKLQIVDGQHRAEGYRFAIYDKNVEQLRNFEVPVIIIPAIDKVTEMRQFRTINGTQKGVRLDLVNMILTQVANRVGESAVQEKEIVNIVVTRTVEALNRRSDSPWLNLIIMPNDKGYSKSEITSNPLLANIKIVRATSFMTSLKSIYSYLNEHEFIQGDVRNQSEALTNLLIDFWSALKSLVPDAFNTPAESVIQKTPGLFALHTVCKRILPRLHKVCRGWTRSDFQKTLERSESLVNPEFWLANGGEASKYGSMKGFTELANIIDQELLA